jgi:hypothetical protein
MASHAGDALFPIGRGDLQPGDKRSSSSGTQHLAWPAYSANVIALRLTESLQQRRDLVVGMLGHEPQQRRVLGQTPGVSQRVLA